MFKILVELFVFYLAYKIIFDLIIPAVSTTKEVKKQFSDIQSKMQEHNELLKKQQNNQQPTSSGYSSYSKPGKDDYIEFEEVK